MTDNTSAVAFVLYRYVPNIPAAIIFAALFAVITGLHIWRLVVSRSWYFTPLVIGVETLGYVGRILAHSNTNSIPIYSMQTLLVLLAPALFAASIYMTLGRTITFIQAERLSVIRVRWMTKIFVSGDVLSFVLQGAGGGIMASGSLNAMKLGEHIIITGLAAQLLFFGFFVITSGIVHFRILKFQVSKSSSTTLGDPPVTTRSWQTVLWGLYSASSLILVRSIFRIIEYAMGNDGYLISHEVFSYVFDATLMFLALLGLLIFHPSWLIRDNARVSETSGTEMILSSR